LNLTDGVPGLNARRERPWLDSVLSPAPKHPSRVQIGYKFGANCDLIWVALISVLDLLRENVARRSPPPGRVAAHQPDCSAPLPGRIWTRFMKFPALESDFITCIASCVV